VAKVKAIIVEIDGRDIKLTLKQAKELSKQLDSLLGKPEKEFVYPYHPYPNPYPVIIEKWLNPPQPPSPQAWFRTTAGNLTDMSAATTSVADAANVFPGTSVSYTQ